jgi:hypothetical protein
MMTTSKTIAALIGPTLIAIALAMLFNLGSFPAMVDQVSRDPALIFLSGILLFVAGLAILRAHNVWTGGWPVLVSALGALAVLGGLGRMFFPFRLAEVAAQIGQHRGVMVVAAIVFLALGGFLSVNAYSKD